MLISELALGLSEHNLRAEHCTLLFDSDTKPSLSGMPLPILAMKTSEMNTPKYPHITIKRVTNIYNQEGCLFMSCKKYIELCTSPSLFLSVVTVDTITYNIY
jgi:hypothetical protein